MEHAPDEIISSSSEVNTRRDFEIRWYDAWAKLCNEKYGKKLAPGEVPQEFVPETWQQGWARLCRERWGNKPGDTSQE